MDQELIYLIRKVSKGSLLFSIPLSIVAYIVAGPLGILASLLGVTVSLLGFYLSTLILHKALKEDKSSFMPILTNIVKAVIIAGLGAFFIIRNFKAGLFYIFGYILLFPSLVLYSRDNEIKNPYIAKKEEEKTENTQEEKN